LTTTTQHGRGGSEIQISEVILALIKSWLMGGANSIGGGSIHST
jgi:hypothetical protein